MPRPAATRKKHSVFLLQKGSAPGLKLLALGFFHIRESQIEAVEGFKDSPGNDEAREPLVVRRNDVPGSVLGGRLLDHLFVRFLIVLPEAALLHVGHGELPILLGILETFEETPFLFIFGDMEKEFADDHAIASEIALESIDVLVALLPDMFGDAAVGEFLRAQKRGMHAHDEHFFVVGAVEDADFAALGNVLMVAPEVIVVQLFIAWRFKS